ncbi:hypothetical protein MF271_16975 (plasmid) [Deinococcus sp. KNUC1210]|uniref:hypothetical protein n=1 Tax=Deinococcus sp. KNUC1210 TaxID=2917691 RepID=UPI001EEF85E2|nr:hypothetical protein [Deinococcus sp. KNUC1210]ULH17020.1 hypothetical protein MF271_16975 [Deinococcus sp. KNUC1210]
MQGFRIAATGQLLPVTPASTDLENLKTLALAWLDAHPGTTDAVLIYTRTHGTYVATVQRNRSGSDGHPLCGGCDRSDTSSD